MLSENSLELNFKIIKNLKFLILRIFLNVKKFEFLNSVKNSYKPIKLNFTKSLKFKFKKHSKIQNFRNR